VTGEVIFRHAEPVMGTVVSFDVRPRGVPAVETRGALTQACAILHRADAVFSLYKPDSPASRLRRGELAVCDCPAEVAAVAAMCEQARELSGGWFDPWAMPGGVDFTGLVKGWAARQAAGALRDAGVGAAMVNAAGDICVFGEPGGRPWRVGVRSPLAADRLLCVVDAEGAVATSGSYERGEHVVNVCDGRSALCLSATVCGPDLALADAFATGLLAAADPGFQFVRAAGYEALLVSADGSVTHTDAFPFPLVS
jgi:thiamine biosynthesis lipoprotein